MDLLSEEAIEKGPKYLYISSTKTESAVNSTQAAALR
jgi:hypothetical protein